MPPPGPYTARPVPPDVEGFVESAGLDLGIRIVGPPAALRLVLPVLAAGVFFGRPPFGLGCRLPFQRDCFLAKFGGVLYEKCAITLQRKPICYLKLPLGFVPKMGGFLQQGSLFHFGDLTKMPP
jgi:hypothetical protein